MPNELKLEVRRILIVDDNPVILLALAKFLAKLDTTYLPKIRAVQTGTEALAEIKSNYYHVCLLDIGLPDISGLTLMDNIAQISPGTRIAMMSANSPPTEAMLDMEARSIPFFPKPLDTKRILAFVNNTFCQENMCLGLAQSQPRCCSSGPVSHGNPTADHEVNQIEVTQIEKQK